MNFFNKINQYEENKKDVNFNSFKVVIDKKPDYEFILFYNSYLSKFKKSIL